jgi:RimJ/RimL family protein N-acetyltransferase
LETDVIVNIEEKIKTLDQHLETERLNIKPLKASDAAAAFPKLQDDDLYRWISMSKPKSVDSLAEDWSRIESRISPDGNEIWLAWFVSSKFDNSPVGSIDVSIDEDGVAVNFGYYFFVNEWGQGYGTEATSAVIQHLQKHQVKKFIATVTAGNTASVAVLKKQGFEFNRTIPNNDTLNGVLVDDDEYVLLTSR